MKLKGVSYVFIGILVVMLLTIVASLSMKSYSNKILPLLVSTICFVLAAIGLVRELLSGNKRQGKAGETIGREEVRGTWRRDLLNVTWVASFVVGIYVLGFILAITVFTLAYMKWLGARLSSAIISAILASAFIYGAFELGLKIELYRGVLFSWLGH